jgi:hypothetical protein
VPPYRINNFGRQISDGTSNISILMVARAMFGKAAAG